MYFGKTCLIFISSSDCYLKSNQTSQCLICFIYSQSKEPRSSAKSIAAKREISTPTLQHSACYSTFRELTERTLKLKLDGWQVDTTVESFIRVSKNVAEYLLPQYELFIDDSLSFTVRFYGWNLPHDHDFYIVYKRSMRNVTVSNLIAALTKRYVCPGIDNEFAAKSGAIIHHCIPKKFELFSDEDSMYPLNQIKYSRAETCMLLTDQPEKCENCKNTEGKELCSLKRKSNAMLLPAKAKAPISKTSSQRIILAMQEYRLENKDLQREVMEIRAELEKCSVPIDKELSKDIVSIMQNTDEKKLPPFMKLFWEEQQKYLQSSQSGIRYHPMVIKFCLNLASKSPAAYNELRYNEKTKSGILVLPSQRTLRSYKNYIRPKQGFNKEIIEELCQKVKDFSDIEKYIVVLIDEMKIQENLVWDKYTGQLIGFVDFGDTEFNLATLKKTNEVASHVLVYLVRGVVNPFKFSFANFATTSATSQQLFAVFWKAVSILQLKCQLKVNAVTCDGASANRRFYRMHSYLLDEAQESEMVYKTVNIFADDQAPRYIYFFADPPHLIKTARNCMYKSGGQKSSRLLWNDGMPILWSHISDIFYEDIECGLHLLPKLTYDHVKLTPFSCMNVRLAAQVLSESVGKVLQTFGSTQAKRTATFCLMMDKFFDCLNVRNSSEFVTKQKPFLKPFSSEHDERFTWLKETFLKYFSDWQESIEARMGNFSQGDKNNMFISWQTYEGIKITTQSVIELTKYLIQNGVSYVLTERFCQDPLENYFGRQRSMGRRKDNPTIRDFGFNDNTIRNQKIFYPIAGNCRPDEENDVDMDINP